MKVWRSNPFELRPNGILIKRDVVITQERSWGHARTWLCTYLPTYPPAHLLTHPPIPPPLFVLFLRHQYAKNKAEWEWRGGEVGRRVGGVAGGSKKGLKCKFFNYCRPTIDVTTRARKNKKFNNNASEWMVSYVNRFLFLPTFPFPPFPSLTAPHFYVFLSNFINRWFKKKK